MSKSKELKGSATKKLNIELLHGLKSACLAMEEKFKKLHQQHELFNEKILLFDKLHGTIYDGFIHPSLQDLFFLTRKLGTPASFGDRRDDYFKLMKITSLEGLTFHEMAQILNFLDTVSPADVEKATRGDWSAENVIEIVEEIYQQMALAVWNKQVDQWKEEISKEKMDIYDKALSANNLLNKMREAALNQKFPHDEMQQIINEANQFTQEVKTEND